MAGLVIREVYDQTFDDLSNRDEIEELTIEDSPDLTRFRSLPPRLDSLYINNCDSLREIPALPDSLMDINIEDCRSLRKIPHLPDNLRSITIKNCESLHEIPHLPDSLQHIFIEKCDNLVRITMFPNNVTNIWITNCASLEDIPDLPDYLKVFNIQYCESLHRIPDLPPSLEYFSVINLRYLRSISPLPLRLSFFKITLSPLANIQFLPDGLKHFVCDLDQLDQLCKNEIFLQSILVLLKRDNFVISRPGITPSEEETLVFITKITEIIQYKVDTDAALSIPYHGQSSANVSKPAKKAFDEVGASVNSFLNPYGVPFNQSLAEQARELGQLVVDKRQGSAEGSASTSNMKLGGRKSKKRRRCKKSRNKRRKHTKKRRRASKK